MCIRDSDEHAGAEHHGVAREGGGVDDLGGGGDFLKLGDAAFDEGLAFARGVVFGVFREIAMATGFRDGADDGGAFRAFEVAQLFFKGGKAGGGHRKFLHCVSSKRAGRPDGVGVKWKRRRNR